ncbi:SecY-interacting protein [Pantoea rodasii]|uniref:Protein Syd n=1 Tax=Pantoea rodasii TaxID=1076549 RepID=A0A2M9W8E1_9GAMM|nr:SecY-interacting protein [Pantoea rodasii]ORM66471.1 SecY-interacting protein [Pantoea rodasii]PJZ03809.1 SecY-interacting protein [Pantoea rodasii]
MMQQTADALRDFTARYVQDWQQQAGHLPASADLLGVPSPCIVGTLDDRVLWQPQPFTLPATLAAVERALEIQLMPEISAFYTTQFAGDMTATFEQQPVTLLQVWSESDFTRLQENLIGHLVMKRRLKQSPTLFIATTESEQDVIALCNLTGEVILEQLSSKKREVLAASVQIFLNALQPVSV